METFYVVPSTQQAELVKSAYLKRGFNDEEAEAAARLAEQATKHGIRTHNALKALHLDDLFGSKHGGCTPNAKIIKRDNRFAPSEAWDANKKLGQAVGYAAINRAIELADQYGTGTISVDNAFHYLWGGGYVMEAAQKGYIAYTNCTATLAEVVPFGGKVPTLGTNPHSWAFPTTEAIGYPVVVDWATSSIAMGRVQQLAREGKNLPPDCAIDKDGNPTTDPAKVYALLPFGKHKGYAMCLLNELYGGFIGGNLPTLRGKPESLPAKNTASFFFQVIHPDALSAGSFADGKTQAQNIKAVLEDIRKDDNASCLLPGQLEAKTAAQTEKAGGLLFSAAEIKAFAEIANEVGQTPWKTDDFKTCEI